MPLLYSVPDRIPVVVLLGIDADTNPLWVAWCDLLPEGADDLAAWVAASWEDASDGGGIEAGTADTPEGAMLPGPDGWREGCVPALGDLIGQGEGLPETDAEGEPYEYSEPGARWRVHRTTPETWQR